MSKLEEQNTILEKITIPLPPRTKKNHQQVVLSKGKPRVVQNKAYREYENAALYFLRPQRYHDPLNIKCLFYMDTRRKVDLVNLLAAIDDIMVKAGTIEDDNSKIIVSHDGSRVYYDKDNPRTEIVIERISEVDPVPEKDREEDLKRQEKNVLKALRAGASKDMIMRTFPITEEEYYSYLSKLPY